MMMVVFVFMMVLMVMMIVVVLLVAVDGHPHMGAMPSICWTPTWSLPPPSMWAAGR